MIKLQIYCNKYIPCETRFSCNKIIMLNKINNIKNDRGKSKF